MGAGAVMLGLLALAGAPRPEVAITGDWAVRVGTGTVALGGSTGHVTAPADLTITPPPLIAVRDERLDRLPVAGPGAPPWRRGYPLRGVITQETTNRYALEPGSLKVKPGPGAAAAYQAGRDYEVLEDWGCVARVDGGTIPADAPVYLDYRFGESRIDTVVVDAAGRVGLRVGVPHLNVAQPPAPRPGELPIANLWLPSRLAALKPENLFPIAALSYPEPPKPQPTPVEQHCPKVLARLRAGQPVSILAWGDSVTDGGFAGEGNRWQEQFVRRLRERFPGSEIALINHGWGGRNSQSFLDEPPGSRYNYRETVLGAKADLIVSEFVNDAGLNPAQVEERYSRLLADFREVGSEWIILTPHYVRPDWMGLASERDGDADPRPYVAGLRAFGPAHGVPIADASLRWGHLWREGIPYMTYMLNAINHPDHRGMKLFADALMAIFPDA